MAGSDRGRRWSSTEACTSGTAFSHRRAFRGAQARLARRPRGSRRHRGRADAGRRLPGSVELGLRRRLCLTSPRHGRYGPAGRPQRRSSRRATEKRRPGPCSSTWSTSASAPEGNYTPALYRARLLRLRPALPRGAAGLNARNGRSAPHPCARSLRGELRSTGSRNTGWMGCGWTRPRRCTTRLDRRISWTRSPARVQAGAGRPPAASPGPAWKAKRQRGALSERRDRRRPPAAARRSGTTTCTTPCVAIVTGEKRSRLHCAEHCPGPWASLARCLTEGFDFQGQPSSYRGRSARRIDRGRDLLTAFVSLSAEPRSGSATPRGRRAAARARSRARPCRAVTA